jgi:hypothetical protein
MKRRRFNPGEIFAFQMAVAKGAKVKSFHMAQGTDARGCMGRLADVRQRWALGG